MNKQKYQNSLAKRFVEGYPENIVKNTETAALLKFNFKFLDVNQKNVGFCDFDDLKAGELQMLFEKIKAFSTKSRCDWEKTPTGCSGHPLLVVYGNIPKNSKAVHPKHVPCDIEWARFRLEGSFRLVGFFIPDSLDKASYRANGRDYLFDRNTFYVVFIDPKHNFYP